GDEAATARAKANLLRAVISGRLEAGVMATAEFKAVMDLCVNCQLCHSECPTAIDIPGMAVMAKEIYIRSRGKNVTERVLTNPGPMLRFGTMFAPLANAALRSAPARRLMAAATGIAAARQLAPFDPEPLAAWRFPWIGRDAAMRCPTAPRPAAWRWSRTPRVFPGRPSRRSWPATSATSTSTSSRCWRPIRGCAPG